MSKVTKRLLIMATLAATAIGGCVAGSLTPSSSPSIAAGQPTTSFNGLPIPATIGATSASRPSAAAADAFAKCHIGDQVPIEEVAGFGHVDSTHDIPEFVPLTGREPQLSEPGGAWIAQIRGDLRQPGGEVWTDPTCVVTESDFGFFATGPVLDTATNKVMNPEKAAIPPSKGLPPLLP